MKEIETLRRKLEFWPKLKNRLLVAGLVAAGLVSGIVGKTYFNSESGIKSKEVNLELISSVKVSEDTIASIKAECLEDAVMLCEFKKHEKLIRNVHKTTHVPEYVLAAMIDVAHNRATRAQSPSTYSWPGFVQVTGNEAGLEDKALKDPEQCLLSAAGKYKSILQYVSGDETVALGIFFSSENTVIMAKQEANRYFGITRDYKQWRDQCDEEDIAFYDKLIEQHKNAETEQEKQEALHKIKLHWDSCSPRVTRGMMLDESVYRALTSAGKHRLRQWWPENLTTHDDVNGVKIASRLKKEGYNTQPIGEFREYEPNK